MHGWFDFIRRVKVLGDMFDAPSRKRPEEMGSFISTCRELGLPLNASKQPIHGLRASVLGGGETHGFNGRITHSREKSMKLMLKTLVLLTFGQVSQTHVQHWCYLFCIAAGFRRPLFSILQEVPPFIQNCSKPLGFRFCKSEEGHYSPLPASVLDELLPGATLSPFVVFLICAAKAGILSAARMPPNMEELLQKLAVLVLLSALRFVLLQMIVNQRKLKKNFNTHTQEPNDTICVHAVWRI